MIRPKAILVKAAIPIIVIILTAIMLWLHREALLAGIFTDYGIEPFEITTECGAQPNLPTRWPSTFGQ